MEVWEDVRIRTIIQAVKGMAEEAYVVGGAVRERLLGQPRGADLDLAVKADGYDLAFRAATLSPTAATFVPLDRDRGIARIVLRDGPPIILDIASLKGADIFEDLRNRDFTMNALAVDAQGFLNDAEQRVLDPTGGLHDLEQKVVRACSDHAFQDDPLRILRAFRFSAGMGFRIARGTRAMMSAHVPALAAVAPERIRDELFAILAAESSHNALNDMEREGILAALFPEIIPMKGCPQNTFHHLDVWDHTLETVRQLELLINRDLTSLEGFTEEVRSYLFSEPVTGRPRVALLKLAALFHDAGKPHARTVDADGRIRFFRHEKISETIFREIGLRLKLASRELRTVGEWIAGHMRPAILLNDRVTKRAVYRLCRRFQRDVVGLLLLFVADIASSRGPARRAGDGTRAVQGVCRTLAHYREMNTRQRSLVGGHELMNMFDLEEGPYLGSILKRLTELQGCGEISSRSDALEAAERIIEQDLRAGTLNQTRQSS